jgi:hypothetical protein
MPIKNSTLTMLNSISMNLLQVQKMDLVLKVYRKILNYRLLKLKKREEEGAEGGVEERLSDKEGVLELMGRLQARLAATPLEREMHRLLLLHRQKSWYARQESLQIANAHPLPIEPPRRDSDSLLPCMSAGIQPTIPELVTSMRTLAVSSCGCRLESPESLAFKSTLSESWTLCQ